MENQVQEQNAQEQSGQTPQSNLLSEEEVKGVLSEDGSVQEEVTLPSETEEFVLPDKFKGKSAEDIAKAYVELEKLKAKQQDEQPTDNNQTQPEQTKEFTQEELSKYVAEYSTNGELSEETYKELADKGLSKEAVNDRIEFIKYKQEKATAELLKPHGTLEDFKAAAEWAKNNWTEAQITNFNSKLSTADAETADALLTGLFSGYNASKQSKQVPDTIHGNTQTLRENKGYGTKSDMMKDMSDPRYKTDAAFRNKVADKLAKTDMDSWY